jgi:hypothetical protein
MKVFLFERAVFLPPGFAMEGQIQGNNGEDLAECRHQPGKGQCTFSETMQTYQELFTFAGDGSMDAAVFIWKIE